MIHITVNGKPRALEGATSIAGFLAALEINPRLVAVAINGDVVPKTDYEHAPVRDGDAIEVVRMVGGGAR